LDEEEKSRLKSEVKMFWWYITTEPARKVRYLFQAVGRTVTPSLLLYVLAVFAIILFINNSKDMTWMLVAGIIMLIGFHSIWKKKRFIHVYRKEKYKESLADSESPKS